MATLADYFDGKVQQEEYSQLLLKDALGTYVGRYTTQTFTFTGVPSSLAHSTAAVTLADLDGKSYTITPQRSWTDGNSGSVTAFATEEVRVSRSRMSLHMWILTVTRIGGELWRGNTKIISGPDWM